MANPEKPNKTSMIEKLQADLDREQDMRTARAARQPNWRESIFGIIAGSVFMYFGVNYVPSLETVEGWKYFLPLTTVGCVLTLGVSYLLAKRRQQKVNKHE